MFASLRVAVTVQLAGMDVTVLSMRLKYSAFTNAELTAETVIVCVAGDIARLVQPLPAGNGIVDFRPKPPSVVKGPPSMFRPLESSTTRWQYGSHGLSLHACEVPSPWVRCPAAGRLMVDTLSPMQSPQVLLTPQVRLPIEHAR